MSTRVPWRDRSSSSSRTRSAKYGAAWPGHGRAGGRHRVPPLARPIWMQHRRIDVGGPYHPREHCRLARGELMHLLGEVCSRRRSEPSQRERAALAEIHLVQIGLEDLRLRVPLLHEDGQPGLSCLAQERPLASEEAILDELLGDGASALGYSSFVEVGPQRPPDGAQVEGAVIEEPMVLRGEHGVDEDLRSGGELDRAEIFSRLISPAREDLAFEHRALHVLALSRDARDPFVPELEMDETTPIARGNFPDVGGPSKLPTGCWQGAGLDVSQTAEGAGKVDHPYVDAAGERLSGGVEHDGPPALEPLEPDQLGRRVDGQPDHRQKEESGEPHGQGGGPSVPCELHRAI